MVSEASVSAFDVADLAHDPSAEKRADVGAKVAARFGNVIVTQRERELSREILSLLVQDAAELVRESLAKSLCQMPGAPKDIILTLAQDIDSIAKPVLESSPVLDDNDLLEIVRKGSTEKQNAIAGRADVSPDLSEALVNTNNRGVVERLVGNEGARFKDETLVRVVDTYREDEAVARLLVDRENLPLTVVEHLVSAVSDELRGYLIKRHEVTPAVAAQLMKESRERAVVNLIDGAELDDLPRLVRQLAENGRLTPTLILRALCMGEMRFFETAMAQLTDLPTLKSWSLIHDQGPLGLKAIFARAKMPQVLLPAFRAAIDIYREMDYTGAENDRQRFRLLMLERLLTSYEELEADDLDFLLARMSRLSDAVKEEMPAVGTAI
jgi:uncharacterized protein (DUF2336 family)